MSVAQVSRYIVQNNPVWAWPARFMMGFGYQLHKRLIRKSFVKTLFNGMRIRIYPNCPISSQFMYANKPDSVEIDLLRRHCTSSTYFLDIGANMGAYSVMLLDKTERIVAFEPDPTSSERLENNFKLNQARTPKVERLALSNYVGEGLFSQEQGSPSNQLLSDNKGHPLQEQNKGQPVQVTTLDQYAKQHLNLDAPFVIKLDVEGEEIRVIEGAKTFLQKANIQGLLFESFPDNYSEVELQLKNLGFKITHINHHNYWASKC